LLRRSAAGHDTANGVAGLIVVLLAAVARSIAVAYSLIEGTMHS
jgi:hypothetical protein